MLATKIPRVKLVIKPSRQSRAKGFLVLLLSQAWLARRAYWFWAE